MRVVFGTVLGVAVGALACDRHAASAAPLGEAPRPKWTSCGDLGCRQYDAVEDAFNDAIALPAASGPAGTPLVVAIGEAHAQRGGDRAVVREPVSDAAAAGALGGVLPTSLSRSSTRSAGCTKVTQEVRKKQETVTTSQAPTDQSEYVTMGTKARALGIIPDLLRPTCADLDAIEAAGDEAVDASLRTIERLTLAQVEKLLERDAAQPADKDKMVVTYGGALHNALHPSPERAAWSFGPALDAYTKGRYVEIDLYVPEFMDDTDSWKKLPFYSHYDRARLGKKTTVFRDGNSVVIIFPLTASPEH